MTWTASPGRSGHLLLLTNETGFVAKDVSMQLRGHAVGGMFGNPEWSFSAPQIADGQSVEAPFRAAWGAATDPPRLEITWTAANGQTCSQTLLLPL
ncbi:Uncharacterised protein [Mycobacteroides abscessus subsp. massiliense]|uniref:hypothetical protein n=1 Tax=Mycobacteroides abscessus TaxID=36809 RepID=UPI0009A68713|nr:hypothetical protein [Mycobacteroides abscessus]SKS09937.1 Uncharacterised protein [Mycobacteroides abscessus subsp. massiliense]